MNNVYSLRDRVASAYFAPFVCANDAVAIRSVVTAATMDNTIVSQNPDDFDLYLVGTWDPSTGAIAPTEPTNLGCVAAHAHSTKEALPHG